MSCDGWKWVCSWSVPLAATLVKGLLINNISEGHGLVNSHLRMYFSEKDYRKHLKGLHIKSNKTGVYPNIISYPNFSLDFN